MVITIRYLKNMYRLWQTVEPLYIIIPIKIERDGNLEKDGKAKWHYTWEKEGRSLRLGESNILYSLVVFALYFSKLGHFLEKHG